LNRAGLWGILWSHKPPTSNIKTNTNAKSPEP